VSDGDVHGCGVVEGTEGPVHPVVKLVLHMRPLALTFERNGGYLTVVLTPYVDEGPMFVIGIDDLKVSVVNRGRDSDGRKYGCAEGYLHQRRSL
jgi:hypothetical protein